MGATVRIGSGGEHGPRLVLASGSPRRATILRTLGLDFAVDPAGVEEQQHPGENAEAFAERLSQEKAMDVAARHPRALILGGDTVVVLDGQVLGKPETEDAAVDMLLRLQGRDHDVVTGLALVGSHGVTSGADRTRVRFRSFDRRAATAYVGTGESMDKAGAYGIQGRGAALVERIEGDYFTVMGFSVPLFIDLLGLAGFRYAFGHLERDSSEAVL